MGTGIELAELAERVDREAPLDGGRESVRAAAEKELMRALAPATAAVRDRLKRRGPSGRLAPERRPRPGPRLAEWRAEVVGPREVRRDLNEWYSCVYG